MTDLSAVTATAIDSARKSFPKLIKKTPLLKNERLSELYGANIYFKREDLQVVRSYKIRGAFNVIQSLSDAEKKNGVVAASAGNHAQGVSIACHHFKIHGTIFMPITTPAQKVHATKTFGNSYVTVELIGDTFDEAYEASQKYCDEQGATFVHPFNDPRTMIGQGTIGAEIVDQSDAPIDYLLMPIGGGGLFSGVSTYFKAKSPQTHLIGVEPAGAAAMAESIKAGKLIPLKAIETFVDGAAVKSVGENTFKICQKNCEKIIRVPENRLCSSLIELLNRDGIVTEPAGVLAIDALKDLKKEIKGKTVVCVVSGSNFDFERLPDVKERSLHYEGLKKYFIIEFYQRPGALREFLDVLGPHDDIARFEYLKKSNKEKGPALIGIETDDPNNFKSLLDRMKKQGILFHDITDDPVFFEMLV